MILLMADNNTRWVWNRLIMIGTCRQALVNRVEPFTVSNVQYIFRWFRLINFFLIFNYCFWPKYSTVANKPSSMPSVVYFVVLS